jgi:hypothetical protein
MGNLCMFLNTKQKAKKLTDFLHEFNKVAKLCANLLELEYVISIYLSGYPLQETNKLILPAISNNAKRLQGCFFATRDHLENSTKYALEISTKETKTEKQETH